MEINKLIKKRLLVFTGTLLIIVILTITSSYALANNDITKTEIQENTNKLLLKYEEGNKLVTEAFPMTKEYGLENATSNKISIINNDTNSTNYSLMLYPTDISDKSIKTDKVYYSINGEYPKVLGDSVDYVIYRGILEGNEKENLTIQVWIAAEKVENEDQGKTLNLDFKVLNY
jgi:predicted Holliday junction resolvase-like endonuclease